MDSVPITLSIGIIAWNEEEAIQPMLESLFRQSLFAYLEEQNTRCEVLCLPNGCSDRTEQIVQEVFLAKSHHHPHKHLFECRMHSLAQRGKLNAWNTFVQRLSAASAQILILCDADIVLHHPDTLKNMVLALEHNAHARVATDLPVKHLVLKNRKSLCDRISLGASMTTQVQPGQVTGQLYAIKAEVARKIYLPKDLIACEDGFIKWLVCTDFLTCPAKLECIVQARDASHIYQAYVEPLDLLRNHKRQMIGQTIVHLLIDKTLNRLSLPEKLNLAQTLQNWDEHDPDWLPRLIAEHVRGKKYFWRLFPQILTHRFKMLREMRGVKRVTHFPVAVVGWLLMLWACRQARQFLKQGSRHYWPDTRSPHLQTVGIASPSRAIANVNLGK